MEFTQPTSLPTDQETLNHINALNAQIADKEATIVRNNGVITSLQYTIQQLSNEKADLESKIPFLTEQVSKLKTQLSDLEVSIEEATKTLNATNELVAKQISDIEQRINDVKVKEEKTEKKAADLDFIEQGLISEKNILETEKAALADKINKLKEII